MPTKARTSLHPRQANACVLRPTVDPGLRREDGERGANFPPRHAGDVGAIARKLLVLANALVRDLVAYQKKQHVHLTLNTVAGFGLRPPRECGRGNWTARPRALLVDRARPRAHGR